MKDRQPLPAALEAAGFGRYLAGTPIGPQAVELYCRALEALDLAATGKDSRLLAFIARHPASTGLVDAGVALIRPSSVVRRRLLLMTAILEASPEHADRFLPQRRSFAYTAYVGFVAIRAGSKAIAGALLVALL